MHKLLNLFVGKPEEINGNFRCPTYLYRWVLLNLYFFKVYLHHFVGNDWSKDFHDHPKRFITIGLKGSYIEETPSPMNFSFFRKWSAPWIRTFPATYRHRLYAENCWTLCIVGRPKREWGFWHNNRWIHWREYVNGPAGDAGQDC